MNASMVKPILLFLIIIILILYLFKTTNDTFSNYSTYSKKMCIIRILGNNINSVHSDTQTYDNLKFTLENEPNFENCDKIWILNRIINKTLESKYKDMLNKYNKKYLIIHFDINEYNTIAKESNVDLNTLKYKNDIYNKLYKHSLYIININSARNIGLKYGRNKYKYTFIFDGSCFLTNKQFNEINNGLKKETEYIIIPLIRLNNFDLNIDFNNKKREEPQIGFKNTSTLLFDERLPYGISNKTELLRRLKIQGPWNKWTDNKKILNINDRPKVNAKTQTISTVCRLTNGTKSQVKSSNDRAIGLLKLVKSIE